MVELVANDHRIPAVEPTNPGNDDEPEWRESRPVCPHTCAYGVGEAEGEGAAVIEADGVIVGDAVMVALCDDVPGIEGDREGDGDVVTDDDVEAVYM